MTAKRQKRTEEPEATTVVYCGPTIPGVANQFTFYRGGIPAALERKAEGMPAMRGLLVPLGEFPEAMKKLQGKFGHIYRLYRLVQEKI